MNSGRLVLDVSITKERRNQPSVGVSRVEREIAKAAFARKNVQFVYFDQSTNEFRACHSGFVGSLIHKQDRITYPREIADAYSLSPFVFEQNDIYINCGIPWGHRLLEVLHAKKCVHDFTSIQVVYDIIPILMPELSPPGMPKAFRRFVIDAAWTSNAIYCISECTRNDLSSFLNSTSCPKPTLRQIKMGVDFVLPKPPEIAHAEVGGKNKDEFVLYVSSIEPRKNHLLIFNIWQDLFVKIGADLPTLVFVGNDGWNTGDLKYFIRHSILAKASKILIVSNLDDVDLAGYYRDCLFSLYPSLYEGWGLPVSESLAYGKFCIASNSSSIPEAGQGLIDQLDPRDYNLWRDRCFHYITSRSDLHKREKAILERRSIPAWRCCAETFLDDIYRNVAIC